MVVVINDLKAGVQDLQRVLGFNQQIHFSQFSEFLKALEVYGVGYRDDTAADNAKKRNQVSHRSQTITELKKI